MCDLTLTVLLQKFAPLLKLSRIFKLKIMSDYNISDSKELSSTPPEIREKAKSAIDNTSQQNNFY